MSGCLLSLVSPVFQKMVCGDFKEGSSKEMKLEDVNEGAFGKVLRLACSESVEVKDVAEAVELAQLADRYQMGLVAEELTEAVRRHLTVETCADVLSWSERGGPCVVEAMSRKMALMKFGEVAGTEGFMRMSEETLGSLLEDDRLAAEREEEVFEAVVRWMKGGTGGQRGAGLLRKVRFAQMEGTYLATRARSLMGSSEVLKDLVLEALSIKAVAVEARGQVELRHLDGSALVPRCGAGVAWEGWLDGGERRLEGHEGGVEALAECMG